MTFCQIILTLAYYIIIRGFKKIYDSEIFYEQLAVAPDPRVIRHEIL